MLVSAHQPGYFPWLGLLDKIAKADLYIVMDEVQLADRAFQHRNIFMDINGDVKFLTLDVIKKGYRDKSIKDMMISGQGWQKRHGGFLQMNYRRCPHFDEVYEAVCFIFSKKYTRLLDVLVDSMAVLSEMLDIRTPVKFQSELQYDRAERKSGLILSLVKAVQGTEYLCGQGARSYMKPDAFERDSIKVVYQQFSHPLYPQCNAACKTFREGLSALDLLFNLGIEKAREIFKSSVGHRGVLCEH